MDPLLMAMINDGVIEPTSEDWVEINEKREREQKDHVIIATDEEVESSAL